MIALMSSTQSTTGVIDLSEKGIPVSVNAPDGAVIEGGVGNGMDFDGVVSHVWEINKGEFSLEVAMEDDEPYYGTRDMGNSVYSTPIVADNVLYVCNRTHLFAIANEQQE